LVLQIITCSVVRENEMSHVQVYYVKLCEKKPFLGIEVDYRTLIQEAEK
jgi:hypothetical protein